jgi:hypothetical protein
VRARGGIPVVARQDARGMVEALTSGRALIACGGEPSMGEVSRIGLDIAKSVLRLMDTIQKIREPLLVVGVVYIPDRCVTALFRKPYYLGTSIVVS